MSELANTIVGILFYESDSIKISELSVLLNENDENISNALSEIEKFYNNDKSSINLLKHNDTYQLILAGSARSIILERDAKEKEGELSKPALEALSTIIYLGQATKNHIDYIRGVQSSYMIRLLLGRGLISKVGKIGRDTLYIPTIETLRYMGLNKIEDMPDYEKIHNDLITSLDLNEINN